MTARGCSQFNSSCALYFPLYSKTGWWAGEIQVHTVYGPLEYFSINIPTRFRAAAVVLDRVLSSSLIYVHPPLPVHLTYWICVQCNISCRYKLHQHINLISSDDSSFPTCHLASLQHRTMPSRNLKGGSGFVGHLARDTCSWFGGWTLPAFISRAHDCLGYFCVY
jgi:hypothetical protein